LHPERGPAARRSFAYCKGPDWAGTPGELRTLLRLTEARSGARVCDPQRAAREHAFLSLWQGARPASLLRLTEPRSHRVVRSWTQCASKF